MWVLSAVVACGVLAVAEWIRRRFVAALRQPPSPERRSPWWSGLALLLVAVAVLLAGLAAFADGTATQSNYQLAWLVCLPGVGALTGIAVALALIAAPRSARGAGLDVLAGLLAVGAFGIVACYGVVLAS